MTDTAAAQLRRILAVIPQLADDDEHSLADVASTVGVDSATLLKDLESIAVRFNEPGGFVDSVQLFIGADAVSVISNQFLRPMRLTVSELRALELGLTMLRSELPPDERSAVERARERLVSTIAKLPAGDSFDETHYAESAAPGAETHLAALRQAFRSHQKVTIQYRRPSTEQFSSRVVCPYAFVISNGSWYLVAHCESSGELRVFRLDRVASVSAVGEEYNIPETFSVAEVMNGNKVFASAARTQMKVRYSSHVARWIAEREEGVEGEDGSLTVTYPLADPDWGVRHVLQYGPEAEILEPETLRNEVRRRLTRIAEEMR